MTFDKFSDLVDFYGADISVWPNGLREECSTFAIDSTAAKNLLNQEHQLNEVLKSQQIPEFSDLLTKVLYQELPPQQQSFLDQVLGWLIPQQNSHLLWWRPALVGCLPLLFGIIVGNFYSFSIRAEVNELDYWEDELTLLSLNDYTENSY